MHLLGLGHRILARSYKNAARLPLYVCDKGTLRLAELRNLANQAVQRLGVKLIVVDYLQLITPAYGSERKTLYQAVTETALGLKLLAQDLGVPVLALSQLSREIEKQSNRPPRLSDLRESGAIEQAANAVLFLHHLSCAQLCEIPLHPPRRRYSPGEDAAMEDEGAVAAREACELLPQVEALLAANRGGPAGKARLLWHAPGLRFLEQERSGTG